MCYHISFQTKLESILDYFPDLVVDPQLSMDFPTAAYINGFDRKPHQVMVTSRKDGKKHLTLMMWGFIPKYIKNGAAAEKFVNGYTDENGRYNQPIITLNAMGEELFDKPMYKEAAQNNRCVVFVDGIYEWQHIFPIGKKGQRLKTPVKYPYHIFLKDKTPPFIMMAGIWNVWTHEELVEETGELKTYHTPTFSIVTTKANALMEKIHNSKKRMPTILTKELALEWIQPGLSKERITEIAAFQYPAEMMEAHSIAKDFQKVVNPKDKYEYKELQEEMC